MLDHGPRQLANHPVNAGTPRSGRSARWAVGAILLLVLTAGLPIPASAVEPSAAPSPEASAAPSAGPDVQPQAPPHPTASPSPTPVPSPSPTVPPAPTPTIAPTPAPTAAPQPTPLSGYRYTVVSTSLRAARSATSAIVAALPRDAQLSVSERLVVSGTAWITATYQGVTGYLPEARLSTTSQPQELVVDRYTKIKAGLHEAMSQSADLVKYNYPGVVVHTESMALDRYGQEWVRVNLVLNGTAYRGYQLWSTTTTMPETVTGTWTVFSTTSLYRYPYAGPTVRGLVDGDRVARLKTVTATNGSRWTQVSIAGATGWVRSTLITGPYRQYVWNGTPNVQQYTNYWCVPASVMTELNMALQRSSTSYSYQQQIYYYGRANLGYRLQALGLDPQAWARSLTYFSGDRTPYWDAIYTSYDAALRAGVRGMRRTGQPIGLLVYHGGHAWTMIGYTATADPARTDHYEVTGVYVAAPFRAWTDPPLGTYYSTGSFRYKMTTYYEPERWTRWNGYYTIILPR